MPYPATNLYPQTSGLYPGDGVEVVPTVTTGSATDIEETTAVLNGIVDPNGLTTHYYFEWSLAPRYDDGINPPSFFGDRTPETNVGAGGLEDPGFLYYPQSTLYPGTFYPYNGGASAVSAGLSGLATGRTYYYTLVAWNGAGISYGDQESFDTLLLSDFAEFLPEYIHTADRGQ